jgi:hypothetical protein
MSDRGKVVTERVAVYVELFEIGKAASHWMPGGLGSKRQQREKNSKETHR